MVFLYQRPTALGTALTVSTGFWANCMTVSTEPSAESLTASLKTSVFETFSSSTSAATSLARTLTRAPPRASKFPNRLWTT